MADDLTFEGWVEAVFAGPLEARPPAGAPDVALDRLTRLFENAKACLSGLPDERVDDGLVFLVSGWKSGYTAALARPGAPWPRRQRCLRGVETLYRQLFAERCAPAFGYLGQDGRPLNHACYMFWDLFPTKGRPADPQFDPEALALLGRLLTIPHVACQESALHGLGHWHEAYPKPVEETVGAFIASITDAAGDPKPGVDLHLCFYAERARTGSVQ